MKKFFPILIVCIVALLTSCNREDDDFPVHGTCGPYLDWTFDQKAHILTFVGHGEMAFEDRTGSLFFPWNYRYPLPLDNPYIDPIKTDDQLFYQITSVVIPEGGDNIEDGLMYKHDELERVTIPKNLKTIGKFAFYACHSLSSLTIPASVTGIDESAFSYCTGLESITFEGTTPPVILNKAFYCVGSDIPVYIPAGTKSVYNKYLPNTTPPSSTSSNTNLIIQNS